MKKIFNIITAAFLLIILSAMCYSAFIIIKARIGTPGIAAEKLNSPEMKLSLNDLSKWQINSLLMVEDPGFYNHKGVDFSTPGAGITTITQGLVKLLYFRQFKPGFAKFKQSLIAKFALNSLISKDDQLVLFINLVYMGKVNGTGIYGFYNASEAYFHKPFKKLSRDEFLSLVAAIIAPDLFNPDNRSLNAERVGRIKQLLSGKYKPVSLMDVYYGPLDENIINDLPKASYYPDIYK